jgi:hypothetical protein
MKKILVILSAALLSACTNYGYVRHEDSHMTTTVSNADTIIFMQRTNPTLYPYLYPYPYYSPIYPIYYPEHQHNHDHKPPSNNPPPPRPHYDVDRSNNGPNKDNSLPFKMR